MSSVADATANNSRADPGLEKAGLSNPTLRVASLNSFAGKASLNRLIPFKNGVRVSLAKGNVSYHPQSQGFPQGEAAKPLSTAALDFTILNNFLHALDTP